MAKINLTVFFLVVSSLMLIAADARLLFWKMEKIAKFRVYVHDVFGGPNPTVYDVAQANITSTSPTLLGRVIVADDLMTAEPNANSQKLGRAQVVAAFTGMDELSVTINCIFLFTAGEYNGSSLSMTGWKLVMGKNQEMPIVGGTGIFRMARGYAVFNIYSQDPAILSLFSYDFYVVYMD